MNKLEALINAEDAGANHRKFNAIKETILQRVNLEIEDQTTKHESEGKPAADFKFEHPCFLKFIFSNLFKEKYDNFHKKQEAEQKENLEKRQQIIEKLKNLYST
jgi:flagellar motility protein MotE (MotC chaperone)